MPKILNCLEIRNETEQNADLYFYGDIVSDWWGAWQEADQYPDAVRNFLAAQEGKNLTVYINSGGGSVFAGIAIYNMIRRHAEKNKVQVIVDGLAGSIASVIAFAGSAPPRIPSNAFLMIHNPWSCAEGNAADLRKMADDLDEIAVGMLNIYDKHLREGVTADDVKKLMDAESWLNGEEAAKYFDIEVTDAVEAAAACGDYILRRADRSKVPDALFGKEQPQAAEKTEADREEAKRETAKARDAVMRSYLSMLTP
ncbi:MAG: Clp protease ClpP [Lachnospiraceae bacterium]|nr:Clp protease ClpP [Lachnospiraceae bacterium]